MGTLFSKKKEPSRVTAHDEAVLQLKSQRDKMKQYMRRSEAQMEREREMAKKLIQSGKKDRALFLLKKKRFQDQMIEKAIKQLDNIERMVHDLEFAEIEARVVAGLKQGNESLKTMHRLLSIEDVEKIMDETREAVEYQNEIDSIISGQLTDTDMADVEDELAALLGQTAEPTVKLPDVPAEPLPEPEREPIKGPPAKLQRRKEAEMVPAS